MPFLWLAFLIAGLIGDVAAARWIGSRVLPEESAARPSAGSPRAGDRPGGHHPGRHGSGGRPRRLGPGKPSGPGSGRLRAGCRLEAGESPRPRPDTTAADCRVGKRHSRRRGCGTLRRRGGAGGVPHCRRRPLILSAGDLSPPPGSPAARLLAGDRDYPAVLPCTLGQILCPAADLSRGALELEGGPPWAASSAGCGWFGWMGSPLPSPIRWCGGWPASCRRQPRDWVGSGSSGTRSGRPGTTRSPEPWWFGFPPAGRYSPRRKAQ